MTKDDENIKMAIKYDAIIYLIQEHLKEYLGEEVFKGKMQDFYNKAIKNMNIRKNDNL